MKYFFILFLFVACEKAPNSLTQKESLSNFNHQTHSDVTSFVSYKNLAGILSKEYYELKTLLPQNGSYIELFSHSRSLHLKDGIKIKIERNHSNLKIQIGVQAYPYKTLLEELNYFKNHSEIDFTLEVENGTNYGFRVQIWENFLNKTGVSKQKTKVLTVENLLVDSLQESLTFYSKGQGLKWGVRTYRSEWISAFRIPSKKL